MSDEGKGRWVEKGPYAADLGLHEPGSRWRAERVVGDGGGGIWTYFRWEEELPLPDKPGVRFWGVAEDHGDGEPKWWFSAGPGGKRAQCDSSVECFHSQNDDYVHKSDRSDLTRLPDPEH